MKLWYCIYDTASGRILRYQTTYITIDSSEGWMAASTVDLVDGLMVATHDVREAEQWMVQNDAYVPRPDMPTIPLAGTSPLSLDLSTLDAAAIVTVSNSDGDSLTVTDFKTNPLVLDGADVYMLQIEQPWPNRNFLPRAITVTE